MSTAHNTLLIDAGNTRIKWMLADENTALHVLSHGAAAEELNGDSPRFGYCDTHAELPQLIERLVESLIGRFTPYAQQLEKVGQIEQICGVCVAGANVSALIEQALCRLGATQTVQWLTGLTPLSGLRNHYATPETLGADRWLAAYGTVSALHHDANAQIAVQRSAALLATFGTATTVDAVYWDKSASSYAFAGGIIIAGLETALRSVSTSTAQLPDLSLALDAAKLAQMQLAITPIPNTTTQALLHGAVLAQLGAVHGFAKHVEQLYGVPKYYIAGGGASQMIAAMPHAKHLVSPVFTGLMAWLKMTG